MRRHLGTLDNKNGPIAGATFKEARKGGTSEKSFQGTALRHRAECRDSREHLEESEGHGFCGLFKYPRDVHLPSQNSPSHSCVILAPSNWLKNMALSRA